MDYALIENLNDLPSLKTHTALFINLMPEDIPLLPKLSRFVKQGGGLLLQISPVHVQKSPKLDAFLNKHGISRFKPGILTNERHFLNVAQSPSNHQYLYADRVRTEAIDYFGTLQSHLRQKPIFIFKSAQLEPLQSNHWKSQPFFIANPETFVDLNKNLKFDQGSEVRTAYTMAVSVKPVKQKSSGRLVVVGSHSIFNDIFIRQPVTQMLAIEVIRWLAKADAVKVHSSVVYDIPHKDFFGWP